MSGSKTTHQGLPSLWSILPAELNKLKHEYDAFINGTKEYQEHVIGGIKTQLTDIGNLPETFSIKGNIAILHIEGVIFPKADIFSLLFGGSTLDVLTRDFKQLIADDGVSAIILDIDSPGGVAFGVQEFANLIFENRSAKPIVAITSAMMASAACWIGTAASEVFITDEATMTGSIGVVIEHIDVSELERKIGIKTTEITAGREKRIASSVRPLSDEGREVLQSQVDHVYNAFTNDVASFRGVGIDQVLSNMADGKLFIGSQAIEAGLIDDLVSSDDVIDNVNETARIRGVEDQLIPGHETLIQTLKLDGKTTGAQAAVAVLKAEKKKRTNGINTGNGSVFFNNNLNESGGDTMFTKNKNDLATKESQEKDPIKAAWENGPDASALRKEFGGDFDSYKAFFEHDEHFRETGEIKPDKRVSTANISNEEIKIAWETGPNSASLKKEFGGDFDSYRAYFENENRATIFKSNNIC